MNRASALRNYQKVDVLADQVYRFAKVRTAKYKKQPFRFSELCLTNEVPSKENRFKTTFGGHLSVSQDGLFFPIFKTMKKQNPHSRSEKTGDKKGTSALVSVFKLEKTGSLSGGAVFLLLPVIRVE